MCHDGPGATTLGKGIEAEELERCGLQLSLSQQFAEQSLPWLLKLEKTAECDPKSILRWTRNDSLARRRDSANTYHLVLTCHSLEAIRSIWRQSQLRSRSILIRVEENGAIETSTPSVVLCLWYYNKDPVFKGPGQTLQTSASRRLPRTR